MSLCNNLKFQCLFARMQKKSQCLFARMLKISMFLYKNVKNLNEGQFRDLMNQDPPTQWVLFLSCNVFLNLFLVKLLFFFWNTMDYFFIVKVVVASLQEVKCSISLPHDITVNTHCHVTMWMWCFLGNYVMSQWVGDVAIDTKQSCDKQPGSFTQDPGGMKTWIFQLKNWI